MRNRVDKTERTCSLNGRQLTANNLDTALSVSGRDGAAKGLDGLISTQ
jgi:hypothetical protein